jgi:hypothetical protein
VNDKTVLELISEVDEFLELHNQFQDADIDIALSKIVRIISNPDINPVSATTAIIQLQAFASKFYIQANYLKNMAKPKAGSAEYNRKNMLFSISSTLQELVASLKYAARG